MKITTLLVKLASIAVHAEELLSADGREADRRTILSLLSDDEVRSFLDDRENQALLPRKRSTDIAEHGGGA